MKPFINLSLASLLLVTLAGCASNPSSTGMMQGSDVPSSDYLNRQTVASPAAKISAGSGAMHTGMSGGMR